MQTILTYIDESGHSSPKDDEDEYLLASISIHESVYKTAEDLIQKVKKKYFPEELCDNIEIHATDIISGKKDFKGIDVETRLNIITDVLNIISKIDCKINCILIRKHLVPMWDAKEINSYAFKFLFERLCFTHNEFNWSFVINKKDVPQYGILFMDSIQPTVDNKLKEDMRALMKSGTEYAKNKYMIEDVVFVDSRYRALSQIVDVVAYCMRRYYRLKYKPPLDYRETKTYERFLNLIIPAIRKKNNRWEGVGVKIFPKR